MRQVAKTTEKTRPSTLNVEFLAVGTSAKRGNFLLVAKGKKNVVLSVRGLARQPLEELERMEVLNISFLVAKTRNVFLAEAQAASQMEPTFKVTTQIGWSDDVFVTPSGVYPPQLPVKGMPKWWSRIQAHLDAKDEDVHSRFRRHGSALNSMEIFRFCKGNSRLMFAAAFSFVGPICKPFGLRAPGVQAVGDAASGKTVFGIVAGATWGGIPDSTIGFGSTWNGTPNGLEEYAPAHHQTLMVLDETSLMPTDEKGRVLLFGEALMRLMQGQGKKRLNASIERWSSPLISTSNFSVYRLLDAKRREKYEAYVDRLIDIPAPDGSSSFFEERHGYKDDNAFGQHLFDSATQNFGHPSCAFLTRFTEELEQNRSGLTAVVAGHVAKYKAAAGGIVSPTRNVQRVRGYFATVYAAGCLAIRYKILPFTDAELLGAIMSCHRDHVIFVDAEVAGARAWTPAAFDTAPVATSAIKGIVQSSTLFGRVKRFMEDSNRMRSFRDARIRGRQLLGADYSGYVLRKDGKRWEYGFRPSFSKKSSGMPPRTGRSNTNFYGKA